MTAPSGVIAFETTVRGEDPTHEAARSAKAGRAASKVRLSMGAMVGAACYAGNGVMS